VLGTDGLISDVTQVVHWWFEQKSTDLMKALKQSSMVKCGSPKDSYFYSDLIQPQSGMGAFWHDDEREIVREWISKDCPIPEETPQPKLTLFSSEKILRNHLVGKIRGMGARG